MPHAIWTEERVERLTAMWEDGQSASEIADILGETSRNAVIGKVTRLGLSRNESAVHAARMGMRPKKVRAPARKGAAQTRLARERSGGLIQERKSRRGEVRLKPSRLRPEMDAAPSIVFDASLAKPWTERKFGECAYPISGECAETHSCCQPTDATYCAAHASIMFQPVQPSMKRTMRIGRLAA